MTEPASPGKILAGPDDVCACGHRKTFHAWFRAEGAPGDSPAVSFQGCVAKGCWCVGYANMALQPAKDITRVQHSDDSLGFYLQEYQDAGGVSERWVKG